MTGGDVTFGHAFELKNEDNVSLFIMIKQSQDVLIKKKNIFTILIINCGKVSTVASFRTSGVNGVDDANSREQ